MYASSLKRALSDGMETNFTSRFILHVGTKVRAKVRLITSSEVERCQMKTNRNGVKQALHFRIADAAEKAKLWPELTAIFPYWQAVSDRSHREFPIIILEPAIKQAHV